MTDHGMAREELPGSRREKREWDPRAADDEPAVGIPQWGRDWWWLVAITGTILFLLLAATEGWVLVALVFAFAGGIVALTCQKVLSRRRAIWAERRREELCERVCLGEVVLAEQQRVPTRGGEPSTEHRLAAGLGSGRQGLPKAPAGAIVAAVLFGATAFVLLYLISVSKPPAAAKVQRPTAVHASANTSAPARVVQAYFAAINEHDWQVVWRLWAGSHKPGHGPAYEHMIAGSGPRDGIL